MESIAFCFLLLKTILGLRLPYFETGCNLQWPTGNLNFQYVCLLMLTVSHIIFVSLTEVRFFNFKTKIKIFKSLVNLFCSICFYFIFSEQFLDCIVKSGTSIIQKFVLTIENEMITTTTT